MGLSGDKEILVPAKGNENLLPHLYDFFSAIVSPWLVFGLSPPCPLVVWCHLGEINSFSAMLAHNGLVEGDQLGNKPLKYSATAGN